MREIVMVLARHGFSHFLERAHLLNYVPGLLRKNALTPLDGPDTIAERFAAALEELGPVFVKFGQLLSTRPDLLADDFIAALERLQDQVPPEPVDLTRRTLEAALGAPPEKLFAEFSWEPAGCGSIAQAHRAKLPTGEDVIVKVRRAGVEAAAREDLTLLGWLAELAQRYLPDLEPLQPRALVGEFAVALERELDFNAEATAAQKFAELARDQAGLYVPEVFWRYVRRDILVLAYAPGIKLSDPDWDRRGGFDRAKVAATVADVFLRQYFTAGFFHADPHPGNIFVVADDRVALIDFGQTGRVPGAVRRKLALMLAALSRDDVDFAAEIVADLGHSTAAGHVAVDGEGFRTEFRAFVDRYFGMPAERMDFAEVITGALGIARRHGLRLPRELVLLVKSLATIAGVVRRIDPAFRFDRAARPYAKRILAPVNILKGLPRQWSRQAYRLFRLAAGAPETVQELLDKTRRGQLRIVFQHDGLEARFAQAESAINRLSVGLIVAGITIGSAIVLASGGARDLGDLSAAGWLGRPASIPITVAIAGTGMTVAIMIGLWVIWGVLRTPRKPHPPPDEWEE